MLLLPGFNSLAAQAFLDPFRAANYLHADKAYDWQFLSPAGGTVVASNSIEIVNTVEISCVKGVSHCCQQEVMQILQDYARARHFVVIAIHGLSLAPRYCDRLCLMNKGRRVQTDVIDEALDSETPSPVFNVEVDVDLDVDLDNLPLVVLAQ
jgi:hypothetical protein